MVGAGGCLLETLGSESRRYQVPIWSALLVFSLVMSMLNNVLDVFIILTLEGLGEFYLGVSHDMTCSSERTLVRMKHIHWRKFQRHEEQHRGSWPGVRGKTWGGGESSSAVATLHCFIPV